MKPADIGKPDLCKRADRKYLGPVRVAAELETNVPLGSFFKSKGPMIKKNGGLL
jgi:hypothetical protein